MNVPHVFRKALDGFIIPPRTFMQMAFSAGRGAMGLMNSDNRNEFIETLDKGTINEGVISQATAGPLMMLSLFHDLQNPLFKQNNFEAREFLSGVGLALERFHNVSGALENQLRTKHYESKKKETNKLGSKEEAVDENQAKAASGEESNDVKAAKDSVSVEEDLKGDKKEPDEAVLDMLFTSNSVKAKVLGDKNVASVIEHDWNTEVEKDPDSMAGQLSRMVTPELFNIHQVGAKTAFLLQPDRNISFKEGSCTVDNVALLSARAFLCAEKDNEDGIEKWGERSDWKYEVINYDMSDAELKRRKGGVAAQMEVLYDVTQSFTEKVDPKDDKKTEDHSTTVVSVAVLEGWLSGGPEDQLRWRLALHRPAFEFPGLQ